MSKLMNLVTQEFEGFEVIKFLGRVNKNSRWLCKCSCGKEFESITGNLRSGHTSSCGCRRSESISKAVRKHGATVSGINGLDTPEYVAWLAMKYRCTNENATSYHNYGGRGIVVCDRWIHSFENFLSDMGIKPTPNHSLDRINNNEGYSPDNCRWASKTEQGNNRRTNINIILDGKTKTLYEWSTYYGVNYGTVIDRYNNGWDTNKLFIARTTEQRELLAINIDGEIKTLRDWSIYSNLKYSLVAGRYSKGKRGKDLIAPLDVRKSRSKIPVHGENV